MLGHKFYHQLIRKYTILFGTLFNDIHISRDDLLSNEISLIKVPLSYGPKDKMLARINQDPSNEKETAIDLPRMSFELSNMYYDGDRKLNKIHKLNRPSNTSNNNVQFQYMPVPYNFNFTLYIYTKNSEDSMKIIEQILPFFTPSWDLTVDLIPENNISLDVPIVHISVQSEDAYDAAFKDRRTIIWTLDFIMKGYLYGPIYDKPIIKFSNTNFFFGSPNENENMFSSIQVKPGLDANGNPTNNAILSINTNNIKITDNFGYIIDKTGNIILE